MGDRRVSRWTIERKIRLLEAIMVCVEEHPIVGQWITEILDRKTEPSVSEIPTSSEKPNNCEVKNYCDDCLYTDTCDSKEFFYACTSKATISKMEQVDKDTNVRSKEPQTEPLPKTINGVKIADAVAWADKWLEDNPISEMWDMIRTLRDATEWQDEPQTEEWYTYQDEQEYNARHGKE